MDQVARQVAPSHYRTRQYLTDARFASFRHLLLAVLEGGHDHVAEVGIGSGILAACLRSMGVRVSTIDFDPDLSPDYVADVRELEKIGRTFDCVICAQVLEHLPYSDFKKAVASLLHLARREVLITIPDRRWYFWFGVKIPGANEGGLRLDFPFIARAWHKHVGSQHEWEMNARPYTERRIRGDLNGVCGERGFFLHRHSRISRYPYHHFWSLRRNETDER